MFAPQHPLTVVSILCICLGSFLFLNGCSTASSNVSPATSQASPNVAYTASAVTESIPSSAPALVTGSYFGMHIHRLADPTLTATQLTPFPSFQFSTMRLWDNVDWAGIEPERDTYNWTRMDENIQRATANGVQDFIFTFGYVPQWASSNPGDPCSGTLQGGCDAPANLSDLDNFTSHLVQRYCGVVKYYETWNEPSSVGFWNGTNQQLLAIAQHIYSTVKDPANCGCANGVCVPGGGSNPNKVLLPPVDSPTSPWLQNWLSFVGPSYPYADVAAFHGYGYDTDPENIQSGVKSIKGVLAKYGLGSVELWNTEASWGAYSGQTQDQETSWLMRYHIVQAFSGVSRFTWYAYDNCEWGTLWGGGICDISSTNPSGPHKAAVAYATVQRWLTGATMESCQEHADGTWLCKFTRPGTYVAWAAWNSNGSTISLSASSMPGVVQYRDWQNQKTAVDQSVQLGAIPVLLENEDGF